MVPKPQGRHSKLAPGVGVHQGPHYPPTATLDVRNEVGKMQSLSGEEVESPCTTLMSSPLLWKPWSSCLTEDTVTRQRVLAQCPQGRQCKREQDGYFRGLLTQRPARLQDSESRPLFRGGRRVWATFTRPSHTTWPHALQHDPAQPVLKASGARSWQCREEGNIDLGLEMLPR